MFTTFLRTKADSAPHSSPELKSPEDLRKLSISEDDDLNLLLSQVDFSPETKTLIISDLDGTMRPDDHHPYTKVDAIDPKIGEKLSALNARPNLKIATFSSRSAGAIMKSNVPPDLHRFCSNGVQYLQPFDLDEGSIIKHYLGPNRPRLSTMLYLLGNAIAQRYHARKGAKLKKSGFGHNLTAAIKKYFDDKSSKALGAKTIVENFMANGFKPDCVIYFGNGKSDLKGMNALNELAKQYGFDVKNVFVTDPEDTDDAVVTHRLNSYLRTHKFFDSAYNILCKPDTKLDSAADFTVATHNIQGNVIPLPDYYINEHKDLNDNRKKDRLHHNRVHAFQEFSKNSLVNLIGEDPGFQAGYKEINGLHVFWAPDFEQNKIGMQYMVTTAPTQYFKLEQEPWFKVFESNITEHPCDKLIRGITGWGKRINAALAVRLKNLKDQTIQVINFHLPAVSTTNERLKLLHRILRDPILEIKERATVLAGDFNPLDNMLRLKNFFKTRNSPKSEEARLERTLKRLGFTTPFRTKAYTHLDKRALVKPLFANFFRRLDLIAVNRPLEFAQLDEVKAKGIREDRERLEKEQGDLGKRWRKHYNVSHDTGYRVGRSHGSDHNLVKADINFRDAAVSLQA